LRNQNFLYRPFLIAVLVCALPGIFSFGAEPASDLPNEIGGSPVDGQESGEFSKDSEDAESPDEAEVSVESTAGKEPGVADVDGPTGEGDKPAAALDQFRDIFKLQLDQSADWVDGLLGTDDFDNRPENTSGRVAGNVYWQNREGFIFRGRFRVRFNLDAANNRFNAMIGRGDPTQMMSNQFEETSRFASFYQGFESDEFLAGVAYLPDWAAKNSDFSIGGGVRLSWPPAPYINLNYRGRYVTQSEEMMVNFYQTFYYRTDEGFGSTTTIEPVYLISENFLIRWYNAFNVSEEVLGLRYESYLTLYQDLGPQRALAYQLGIIGETGRVIPFVNYGATVTYRQQMFREWLYGEVTVGLAWPREFPSFDRKADPLVGFGVEFFFGDGY
jgi:hypothetical protein